MSRRDRWQGFEEFLDALFGTCQKAGVLAVGEQQEFPIRFDLADQTQVLFSSHEDFRRLSFSSSSMSMASLLRPVPDFIAIR